LLSGKEGLVNNMKIVFQTIRGIVLLLLIILTSGCAAQKDWVTLYVKDVAVIDERLKVALYYESGTDEFDIITPRITGMHPGNSRTIKSSKVVLQFDWPKKALQGHDCSPKKVVVKGENVKHLSTRTGLLKRSDPPRHLVRYVNGNTIEKRKCSYEGVVQLPCLVLSSNRHLLLHGFKIYDADSMLEIQELDRVKFTHFLELAAEGLPSHLYLPPQLYLSNNGKKVVATFHTFDGSRKPIVSLGYVFDISSGEISKIHLPENVPKRLEIAKVMEDAGNFHFLLRWNSYSDKAQQEKKYNAIYSYPEDHLTTLSEMVNKLYLGVFSFHWDVNNKTLRSVHGWYLDQLELKTFNYARNEFYSKKLCIKPK